MGRITSLLLVGYVGCRRCGLEWLFHVMWYHCCQYTWQACVPLLARIQYLLATWVLLAYVCITIIMHTYPSFPLGTTPFGSLPPPSSLSSVHWSISQGMVPSPLPLSSLPLGLPTDLSIFMSMCLVPNLLVQLIQSGRYIEMRDLLWDNITARRHYEEMHSDSGFQLIPVSSRPRVREVTSLSSWTACFLTCLAVWTQDHATRDHITYALLVIQKAMWQARVGWTMTGCSDKRLQSTLASNGMLSILSYRQLPSWARIEHPREAFSICVRSVTTPHRSVH